MNRFRQSTPNGFTRSPKRTGNRAAVVVIGILIGLFVLLMAGCNERAVATQSDAVITDALDASPQPDPTVEIPNRPAAVAVASIDDSSASKAIEGFGIESVIQDDDAYKIAAHYPVTDRETIDELLESESELEVSSFLSLVSELPRNGSEAMYEYNRDFDSHIWSESDDATSGRLVSFLFRSKMVLDKPVPNFVLKSYIFDIEEGKQLQLADLIDSEKLDSGDFYAFLSEKSKEKLKSQPINGPEWDDEVLEAGLKPIKDNFTHYYLDGQDLVLVFDVYQLGPYSLGTPSVRISYSEFGEYLSDFGKSILETAAAAEKAADTTPEQSPSDTGKPTATPSPAKLEADGKYIALTFDDGPHKKLTPRLLDILQKYDAKATFFVLGNRLGYATEIIQRMYDEGHEIGNHSDSHKDLTKMSASEVAKEMAPTNKTLQEIIGLQTSLMRPPYGATNDNVRKYARDVDIPIILWQIDPEDWKYKDSKVVSKHIIDNVKPGDIVLLHDIHETSVDAAEIVLKELTKQGYTFVTVSQLLPDMKAGESYRRVG